MSIPTIPKEAWDEPLVLRSLLAQEQAAARNSRAWFWVSAAAIVTLAALWQRAERRATAVAEQLSATREAAAELPFSVRPLDEGGFLVTGPGRTAARLCYRVLYTDQQLEALLARGDDTPSWTCSDSIPVHIGDAR